MRPKKVAIVGKFLSVGPIGTPAHAIVHLGAGPSGLVTAKTLLHNFPRGTFSPVIFDTRHEVGGLWPKHPSGPAQKANSPTLDPAMRTNLSRFTVAFSDLSWESAMGDADPPMFPQARQVGQYLAAYVDRYIPNDVLRLGHRVTRALRTAEADPAARWKVEWSQSSDQGASHRSDDVESEDFDFLVVASGYFARPFLPEIPGLENFAGKILHSSTLHRSRDLLPYMNDGTPGSIAVIGGSMSGVEGASAAALWRSSSVVSTCPTTSSKTETSSKAESKIHHVYPRPFWALPTYLPDETSTETVSFLPLDLAMYDLSRRPPGPIEYALGPIPEEKATKTNSYFSSLLGSDYEKIGHMPQASTQHDTTSRPPWVAIGNDYAEFIRSGAIEATIGRVISGYPDPNTGLASIKIEPDNGESKTLDNVATIVMATGFSPFESLSFLPAEVLQGLEYTTDDAFLPLVLDKGGTMRSEIPDIGFVGFYRGPYWGVMEMQAQFLGEEWAGQQIDPVQTADQRGSVRILRHPDTSSRRGQFPMGDYVGLMESFARDLEIQRADIPGEDGRSGPVIPARYVHDHRQNHPKVKAEVQRTLDSLHATSKHDHHTAQAGAALAIFRALHGTWRFTQTFSAAGQEEKSGSTIFHPRYPSSPGYDREYVCEEYTDIPQEPHSRQTNRSILRLSEAGASEHKGQIEAWSSGLALDLASALKFTHSLRLTPFYRKKKGQEYVPGEYIIYASVVQADQTEEHPRRTCQYTFSFNGVSISNWDYVEFDHGAGDNRPGGPTPRSRIVFRR